MGKLSSIAKSLRETAEMGAPKARAAERAWAADTKQKGQLEGLSEYLSRNEGIAPRKAAASAPAMPERRAEVDRTAPRERRDPRNQKIDLRRRADDAESLASGYRSYADEMEAAPRSREYFVDANKLKALNDNFGFDVGDRLIELQNKYLRDELSSVDPSVKPLIARGPGDEVFLAGNDDAIMREAIERANNKLITEGVHMDLPGGGKRTISGVASLKYGAGNTLDEAEQDLMSRKTLGLDNRGDASEAIDVTEEPREREGSLQVLRKYLGRYEGGLISMSDRYPDAIEGEYEDGDKLVGEDDDYEYYECGGVVHKGLGGFLKKAVKKVAKVGKVVAPILGKIPGIGTVAGGIIGGLSGLIADGNLKGALSGALNGVSGGLSGWAKLASTVGAQGLDMSNAKHRAKVAQAAMAKQQGAATGATPGASGSVPSVDLAALRQQALSTADSAPTQLSMVQPQAQRVQPAIQNRQPGGLLQQIQAQQAQMA